MFSPLKPISMISGLVPGQLEPWFVVVILLEALGCCLIFAFSFFCRALLASSWGALPWIILFCAQAGGVEDQTFTPKLIRFLFLHSIRSWSLSHVFLPYTQFDSSTGLWSVASHSLSVARSRLSAVVVGDNFLFCGGTFLRFVLSFCVTSSFSGLSFPRF
jgi:hypothetical protein